MQTNSACGIVSVRYFNPANFSLLSRAGWNKLLLLWSLFDLSTINFTLLPKIYI